jgi:putative hydrolase of the HAD superfamily
MSQSVTAVIFDFGGVIAFHPPQERFDRIAQFCDADPKLFDAAFWRYRREYDASTLTPEEYWAKVAADSGFELRDAAIPQLVRMETELWTVYDERVIGYVATLRSQGWATGMLSNLPPAMGAELRATPGLLDNFDHLTFSFELGVAKPQRKIYEHAYHGLGVEPADALFLDDRPDNVEGARQASLNAEIYSDWERFVEETIPRYGLPIPDDARRQ